MKKATTKDVIDTLTYLSKHAQKAYKEILRIIERPDFLFSNDRTLTPLEALTNYRYIHGFTRLLRKGTISLNDVTQSFIFLEAKVEEYLKNIYKDKDFKLIVYGDVGIPGFTLTVTSFYENQDDEGRYELNDLVKWFAENALYNGLHIEEGAAEEVTDESSGNMFKRYYSKIIKT
ncbi:hypothetical protein FRY98_12740 [Paenibacillus faecis]|uniref:Uncharacterized protein n=1 Tax=Paenibacillus faecis TaxID=862114 RepID=A0A5D0CU51_9BACL|nr:hypothetical protein [Paenibacillus faecis]TYA13511.1 hypothetical protein FRY98_12740 [Paenibacillus faecis]